MATKDVKVSTAPDKASDKVLDKVQMEKDGEVVVLEAGAVESKKGEGFVVIGEVDADGKVTATVVATPAHTFMTADGFLKVIPENYNLVAPVVPVVPKV